MLQYIDNINYNEGNTNGGSIDSLLDQYAANKSFQIYQEIKSEVLKELKFKELGISRIAPDLLEILDYRNRVFLQCLLRLLCDPFASYSEIGEQVGISKQRVHVILTDLAKKYYWIYNLLEIHNRNNLGGKQS